MDNDYYANEPSSGRPHTPGWVPQWCPSGETLEYVKRAITVALLFLVGVYLVHHLARGGSARSGAHLAAGAA